MAKSKLHRMISLMIAALLLLSSTGFSIDLHFCKGHLKSFSLIGKAKSCHTISNKNHCSRKQKACHVNSTKKSSTENCKKDCCTNKTFKVEPADDFQKIPLSKLTLSQTPFISYVINTFLIQNDDLYKFIIPHLNHIPPLLDRDIPLLIQSFLL